MASALLIAAIMLLVIALVLLVYIMVTQRIWNVQRVWDLAVTGNRLARWYMGVILLAFAVGVTAWLIAFSEHETQNDAGIHTVPNLALQPTAWGGV